MKYKKEKVSLILKQEGVNESESLDFINSLESLKEEEADILVNFFEENPLMAVTMLENFKLKRIAIEKSDFDDLKKIILSEEDFLGKF